MVLDLFCFTTRMKCLVLILLLFYKFAILSKQQTFYQKTENKILVKY